MNEYRHGDYDICSYKNHDWVVDDVFARGRPRRVASSAPIGGSFDPIEMIAVYDTHPATSGISVELPGHDPDGGGVSFHITTLPTRGTLLTSSGDPVEVHQPLPSPTVTYIPLPYSAGSNYTAFIYEVHDAFLSSQPLAVQFNIACMKATQLNSTSSQCEPCPPDSFNDVEGGGCKPCPLHASSQGAAGQAMCECEPGYAWQQDTLSCLKVGIPCHLTGCSEYARCDSDGVHCVCKPGYQPVEPDQDPGMMTKTNYHCELSMASPEEKRVLWSISGYANLVSFMALLVTLRQYGAGNNTATETVVMRSYLAVLIPDAVMAVVYLPFHLGNTLRGQELDEGSCRLLAFLTYGIVIATFTGPIIVAYVAHQQVLVAMRRKVGFKPTVTTQVTPQTLYGMMWAPWVLGFVLATLGMKEGLLGSYRGLICYTTHMDNPVTGGVTFLLLLLSGSICLGLYNHTNAMLKMMRQDDDSRALFFTWSVFSLSGVLGFFQTPSPIWMESLGAIMISLQPLVDSYMILSLGTVWDGLLKREVAKNERRKGVTHNRDWDESSTTVPNNPHQNQTAGPVPAPLTRIMSTPQGGTDDNNSLLAVSSSLLVISPSGASASAPSLVGSKKEDEVQAGISAPSIVTPPTLMQCRQQHAGAMEE